MNITTTVQTVQWIQHIERMITSFLFLLLLLFSSGFLFIYNVDFIHVGYAQASIQCTMHLYNNGKKKKTPHKTKMKQNKAKTH